MISRYLALIFVLGLCGCGYTIASKKALRKEYFYQYYLGKQAGLLYRNCATEMDMRELDEILEKIDNETYEGLW